MFPLNQNLSPKVCSSNLHFLALIHSAVETHTSLGGWSSTRHWMPTLKTWQFANATVRPFPPVPNLLTWIWLDHIHPAAGHRRAIYTLKMLVNWFSLFHFPCLLKIKKSKRFFFVWQSYPAKSVFIAEHFPRCQFCNSGPGCNPLSMMDSFKMKALREAPAVQVHIGSAWLSQPSSSSSSLPPQKEQELILCRRKVLMAGEMCEPGHSHTELTSHPNGSLL